MEGKIKKLIQDYRVSEQKLRMSIQIIQEKKLLTSTDIRDLESLKLARTLWAVVIKDLEQIDEKK